MKLLEEKEKIIGEKQTKLAESEKTIIALNKNAEGLSHEILHYHEIIAKK